MAAIIVIPPKNMIIVQIKKIHFLSERYKSGSAFRQIVDFCSKYGIFDTYKGECTIKQFIKYSTKCIYILEKTFSYKGVIVENYAANELNKMGYDYFTGVEKERKMEMLNLILLFNMKIKSYQQFSYKLYQI